VDANDLTDRLAGIMCRVCDAAMPRVRSPPGRRPAYWWTEDIAELRRASVHARRLWKRERRLDGTDRDPARANALWRAYKSAREALAAAIRAAKASAWEGLLDLNGDPGAVPTESL